MKRWLSLTLIVAVLLPLGAELASAAHKAKYHHSGTRGRLNSGASPKHPEGPGNSTH